MNFLFIQIAWALLLLVQTIVARCPNWCNKRGECTSPADGGYCVCHYGFTGEDCSQRLCPAGFDPVNLENRPNRRTIRLETGHMGGIMMGKYSFGFAGSEVYLPANANDNDDTKCATALKGLKSVQEASCIREKYDVNTGAGSYLISLLSYPLKPYMNNLVHHNGNPGINFFSCNVSKIDNEEASEPFCFVSNADTTTEFPLYAECGNHGVCDRIKGVCACDSGFKGDACLDNSDNENIIEHIHDGPYFTATLVKLHLDAPPSTKFNLFQASLNQENITTIRGDGVLMHTGDVQIQGGIKVGTESMQDEHSDVPANIHGSLPLDSTSHHLTLYTNHHPVYSISHAGDTTIAGTLDVLNHTLTVEPRLLTAQNVKLLNDLHVQGRANIEDSLTIGSGFAMTPGGITVDVATHTGTLFELKSRQVGFNGTLFELNSVGEDNILIRTVTNGLATFELHSSGFVNMNGLRLKSGGVQVESGGVEVSAGGMSVQGGISILSGGLSLPSQPFTVGTLHAISSVTNLKDSLISGTTASLHFAGSMLQLTSVVDADTTSNANSDSRSTDTTEMMSFISLEHTTLNADNYSNATITPVFQVKGSGQIDSTAGGVFKGRQGLDVYGTMLMRGKVALQRAELVATSDSAVNGSKGKLQVVVPLNATYVVITRSSDTTTTSRVNSIDVVFAPSPSSFSAGRILLISNHDSLMTSGSVHIPPHTTVLLVYDGVEWVSVDALKAPMHVLENVRTLTAAADLDIGPHTLSALRFQSTSLHTHSIVYSGTSGVLTTSDKFTYTKGVLAVPAMKVENLLCALDARGNDISNAHLSNAKLTEASISATDLTIPGLAGLAYFNNKGTLQASTTLTLDPEGRLLVSDLYTSVQANGYTISNTTIMRANLTSIGYVKTDELYVSDVASGSNAVSGAVLVGSADGKVSSTRSITVDNGIVSIHKLQATQLSGNLDANMHTISNVNINGNTAAMKSVTTDTVIVSTIADPSSNTNRLVYADSSGKLSAQTGDSVVHINSLSVNDIVYANDVVDFHGRTVKNIVLDTDTFMLGPQKSLYTDELTLTSSANDSVLITNSSGSVISSGMHYRDNTLYVGKESSVYTSNLYTNDITINSIRNSVLSTNYNGTVVGTNKLELDSIIVDKSLSLGATAKLTIDALPPNTLLTLNTQHELTSIPIAYSKSATSVDAYLHNVRTDSLHSAVFSADQVSVKELTLGSPAASGGTKNGAVGGAILVQDKDGKVSALSEEIVYADKGTLHVSSVAPAKGTDSVHITSALLLHSNLSSSHIHNAHSIDTQKLIVKDIAEFYSDVVIDGSVTIHGTVIGSGPYVDSSDVRFKTNITTLTNALDTVNQMRPVTYSFNTAAFPSRQFPVSPQLGFIAQEIESLQPELVYTDSEGYKGVSYAHVNVLLTAAIQEIQVKHDQEMKELKSEVAELKKMVEVLLKQNR